MFPSGDRMSLWMPRTAAVLAPCSLKKWAVPRMPKSTCPRRASACRETVVRTVGDLGTVVKMHEKEEELNKGQVWRSAEYNSLVVEQCKFVVKQKRGPCLSDTNPTIFFRPSMCNRVSTSNAFMVNQATFFSYRSTKKARVVPSVVVPLWQRLCALQ